MSPRPVSRSAGRPRPTDAELEILRVLWRHRTRTVRQVYQALSEERGRPTSYTTVLKLMQIMTVKGLVTRDEQQRPQLYASQFDEGETQRLLLRHLVDRAFEGSHRQLVLQALADRKASDEELAEVEALLDRLEEETR